jgi:nitroreductase
METLVAAAQSAASSSNLQLWSVVAVEDAATRAKLAELANGQKHIAQAPLLLVWLADLSRAERQAAAQSLPTEAIDFLDIFVVATTDAAIAAQNAALAAESLGLGTVYIGALRNRITEVAAVLKLPPHVYPVFGLVVGHPDPALPADIKPRLPQSVVLHRETYTAAGEAAGVAAYDERAKAFQKEQGQPIINWSRQLVDRIGTPAGLNGRERLRQALEGFGFKLK